VITDIEKATKVSRRKQTKKEKINKAENKQIKLTLYNGL